MTGIELLEQSRTLAPGAKLLLLTAYADTDVAIRAINEIGLDYYLFKPWDPPEERLYPVVDDLLGDWQRGNPDQTNDVRVVGHRWSERSHEVKTFLARNHVPYRWFDVERDAEGQRLSSRWPRPRPATCRWCSRPDGDTAALAVDVRPRRARSGCGRRPSSRSTTSASSAAVRPGSRPRCTPRPRACRPSSSSARLPAGRPARAPRSRTTSASRKGLSGADLTQRAVAQVSRFGAEMVLARDVVGVETRGPVHAVLFDECGRDRGPCRDRRDRRLLPAARGPGPRRAHGPRRLLRRDGQRRQPVSRATTSTSSAPRTPPVRPCSISRATRSGSCMVVRGANLEDTMSSYLVDRITAAPNIEVRLRSAVVAGRGDGHLEGITLADRDTGAEEEVDGELAVHLHRGRAAHRVARRRPWPGTSTGSS